MDIEYKYFVYSSSSGAIITEDENNMDYEFNFIGQYETLKEAKKAAIECCKLKIENYRYDIDNLKESIKELRLLK